MPTRVALPIFFAVTLALSFAVWLLVERPARRFLVGLMGGSATQPGSATGRREPASLGATAPAGSASA